MQYVQRYKLIWGLSYIFKDLVNIRSVSSCVLFCACSPLKILVCLIYSFHWFPGVGLLKQLARSSSKMRSSYTYRLTNYGISDIEPFAITNELNSHVITLISYGSRSLPDKGRATPHYSTRCKTLVLGRYWFFS